MITATGQKEVREEKRGEAGEARSVPVHALLNFVLPSSSLNTPRPQVAHQNLLVVLECEIECGIHSSLCF
jgi:hypothetical protein